MKTTNSDQAINIEYLEFMINQQSTNSTDFKYYSNLLIV